MVTYPQIERREQQTPFGTVTLSSRWAHTQYQLRAQGGEPALRWLFPSANRFEFRSGGRARRSFSPAPHPVKSIKLLEKFCDLWQREWNDRLEEVVSEEEFIIEEDPPGASPGSHVIPLHQPEPLASAGAASSSMTIHQLFIDLHAMRCREIAQSTAEKELYHIQKWFEVLGRDTCLADLTQDRLRLARADLTESMKPSTVNSCYGTLLIYLKWAHENGHLPKPIYRGVRKLKDVRNLHAEGWWDMREIGIALEVAREVDNEILGPASWKKARPFFHTAELMVGMGCLLGLRWGEMVMQRWQSLDLSDDAPVCHVVPVEDWVPKDREARSIPICRPLAEMLRRYQQPEGFMLVPEREMPKRGGTKRVYRYNPQKLWRRVLKRVVQRGCKPLTPHGMRHSFASNLLMAGVSDVKVARWLGHADTKMLHARYGHLMSYDADINAMAG